MSQRPAKRRQKNPEASPEGRPLFDGKDEQEVVSKLEYAWSIGCTDSEAALYAGISRSAIFRYLELHPELQDRKEHLKENPILKARTAVFNDLHKSDLAFQFLRVKKKDEFSERKELTGKDGAPLSLVALLDEAERLEIEQEDE